MKLVKATMLLAVAAAMVSCGNSTQSTKGNNYGMPQSRVDSVSYAAGMSVGMMLKQTDLSNVNIKEFDKALNAVLGGKETKFELMEANRLITKYASDMRKAKSEYNKKEGEAFLAENKSKEGVEVTESGLQYKIIEKGSDLVPTMQDSVEVNYKGMLIDGTVFDSSFDRGESAKFPQKGMLKGWSEGLTKIGEGGKIILYIPSDLGYGAFAPAQIGPNSVLIFEVDLIKVIKNNNAEVCKK